MKIEKGDEKKVENEYLRKEKKELKWEGERVIMKKKKVKIILNMIIIGNGEIKRGGYMEVSIEGGDKDKSFVIKVKGRMIRVKKKLMEIN